MFLFYISETLLAYDHSYIRFLKAKEAILNGDANDTNRGNHIHIVLSGVNCLLSPIA